MLGVILHTTHTQRTIFYNIRSLVKKGVVLQSTETPRAAPVLLLPKEKMLANQKVMEYTFPNDPKQFWDSSFDFSEHFHLRS